MTPARRKTCRAHRAALDAIVDGREALGARQALELHARTCPTCGRALRTNVALRGALDAAVIEPTLLDDGAFAASVFARIDDGAARANRRHGWPSGSRRAPRRAPQPGPRRWASPIAVALAAGLLAVGLLAAGLEIVGSEGLERPGGMDESTGDLRMAADDVATSGQEDAAFAAAEGEPVRDTDGSPAENPAGAQASMTIEIDRRPVDLAGFADLLRATAEDLAFVPEHVGSASRLVTEVRDRLDGDARRAARHLLREDPDHPQAGLAARVLGVSADLSDRALLADLLPALGDAAALGLAECGRRGVTELWRIARRGDPAAPAEGAAECAARTLLALARSGAPDRDPLRWIDPSDGSRLGLELVASSPLHGVDALLARALEDGPIESAPWFDAWAAHPDARGSLVDALSDADRRRRFDRGRESNLLRAVAALGLPEALPFSLAALERGTPAAADALASIDDTDAIRALFGLTARGRLHPELEELAWSRMVLRRGPTTLEVALERGDLAEARATDLVDVLIRAIAVDRHVALARGRALVEVAVEEALPARVRVRALLFLADRRSQAPEELAEELPALEARVAALRNTRDPDLAAAAWLMASPADSKALAPRHVRSALERPGSLAVRHARLARAIEHAAGPRGSTTP